MFQAQNRNGEAAMANSSEMDRALNADKNRESY
jgi:hypothetical protein